MRLALAVMVVMAVSLAAGCGPQTSSAPDDPAVTPGTVDLRALCPQVHRALDALVVSNPAAQHVFVVEVQRIADAGTTRSQSALAPLLLAGRTLEQAGRGPDYRAALNGFHPAVVQVDGACAREGAPILHEGPH